MQAPVDQKPQAAISAPTIRGTVGEFIRATLPEAQTRLAEEGVIHCFIETIALLTKQAQNADNGADVASVTSDNQHSTDLAGKSFDFSNYGYQPLTVDYLTRFEAMTQAVSQFAAAQGKTDVEPRAVGKRASNDPRGQHPDYQESANQSTASEKGVETAAKTDDESVVESQQAASEQDVSDVEAQNVEATALTTQAQTDDVSMDSEQLLEADQMLSKADDKQADNENVGTQSVEAEHTGIDTDNVETASVASTEQATASEVEQPIKEDSQAAKSKTTIASYKNMIENVARATVTTNRACLI